ncbi:unnamed protein product [Lepeophtheirus salmonis]|uniref:(salmon louse) hypothetical protein n=1 Tax=Lepeophtheirus salmonis TaxID=72036 RepID=A0A7R8HDZ3_LEPSM|nr:unnamed protein product [Lepeophtheirus salmonis]CAF3020407.1 unnamed protein product [Lepeophtheirus salmonis]
MSSGANRVCKFCTRKNIFLWLKSIQCTLKDNGYVSNKIKHFMDEFDSEDEEDIYVASDDDNCIPKVDSGIEEASDIEEEMAIEHEEEYDSDESIEHDTAVSQNQSAIWITKDETEWHKKSSP